MSGQDCKCSISHAFHKTLDLVTSVAMEEDQERNTSDNSYSNTPANELKTKKLEKSKISTEQPSESMTHDTTKLNRMRGQEKQNVKCS